MCACWCSSAALSRGSGCGVLPPTAAVRCHNRLIDAGKNPDQLTTDRLELVLQQSEAEHGKLDTVRSFAGLLAAKLAVPAPAPGGKPA